jgi:predicted TIM-barrel fold metal-dependent hydrolase
MPEAILEPDLPIIDPHHHLWDLRPLLAHFPNPRVGGGKARAVRRHCGTGLWHRGNSARLN